MISTQWLKMLIQYSNKRKNEYFIPYFRNLQKSNLNHEDKAIIENNLLSFFKKEKKYGYTGADAEILERRGVDQKVGFNRYEEAIKNSLK